MADGEFDDRRAVARCFTPIRKHARPQVLVCVRRRCAHAVGDGGDLIVGVRLRCACRDSAEDSHRRTFERRITTGSKWQRYPQAMVDRKGEAFRHHTYYRARRASELNGLPNHISAAAESLLPDVITEHDHAWCTRGFVGFD